MNELKNTSASAGSEAGVDSSRELAQLPRDELDHLAEEFGLEAGEYASRQELAVALLERRRMIAGLDREAMLDVVKWGRRAVAVNASKEQIAQEIVRIRSMRLRGLSQRGLVVLAQMRGIRAGGEEPAAVLMHRLKKQEGFFSRLNRKRRAILGAIVSQMIGEGEDGTDYQFLPPNSVGSGASPPAPPARQATIKEEIEESGLIGGITGRIKKSADAYVNQKLDDIEARIDRKLDEIDRRLGEWRDREIANRIRILKITLWASVIVAGLSLLYAYVTAYLPWLVGRS
jgi:hypothetical protein